MNSSLWMEDYKYEGSNWNQAMQILKVDTDFDKKYIHAFDIVR